MFLSSASSEVKSLLWYLGLKASRVQAAGDECLCDACMLILASVMVSKHGARLRLRIMLFPFERNLQSEKQMLLNTETTETKEVSLTSGLM